MAKEGYIYVLRDPRTDAIRYVGSTNNPQKRLYGHMKDKGKTAKTKWIRELLEIGLVPRMEIIDTVPITMLYGREEYWIRHHRTQGEKLVNGANLYKSP